MFAKCGNDRKCPEPEPKEEKLLKVSDGVHTYMYNEDGKLHNPNGPAATNNGGYEGWYKDGEPHRDGDNPAIFYPHTKERAYYKNGKLHRERFPAFERGDGNYAYVINGKANDFEGKAAMFNAVANTTIHCKNGVVHTILDT
jgi:hypothetical protein